MCGSGFKEKERGELSTGLISGREARIRLEADRALDMEGVHERRAMRDGRRLKGMEQVVCAPALGFC
jgi:hypothetical protein